MKKTNSPIFLLRYCVLLSAFSLPGSLAAQSLIDSSLHSQFADSLHEIPNTNEDSIAGLPKKFSFEKLGAVNYRNVDGESLNCDVYVPDGPGPFPAVLALHGGAWRQGSKIAMLRHAWKLAQAGYVIVAINYRHAPEHRFPAQLHDCKFAVRWMRAHAERYKIDPDRIAAFGYSAGGHLAAMLGTTDFADGLEPTGEDNLDQFSSRVQAVVVGGAPCEFAWIEEDGTTLVYWLGCRRIDNPEVYERASPTHYVSADDPPFHIFHGELDMIVPSSSAEKLHQLLLDNKIHSQFDLAFNEGHIATFSDLSWVTRAIDFLNANLKPQPSRHFPAPQLRGKSE